MAISRIEFGGLFFWVSQTAARVPTKDSCSALAKEQRASTEGRRLFCVFVVSMEGGEAASLVKLRGGARGGGGGFFLRGVFTLLWGTGGLPRLRYRPVWCTNCAGSGITGAESRLLGGEQTMSKIRKSFSTFTCDAVRDPPRISNDIGTYRRSTGSVSRVSRDSTGSSSLTMSGVSIMTRLESLSPAFRRVGRRPAIPFPDPGTHHEEIRAMVGYQNQEPRHLACSHHARGLQIPGGFKEKGNPAVCALCL